MSKYIEYREFEASDEVKTRFDKLHEGQVLNRPPFAEAGFYKWLTELSKDGWRPIWQSLVFPHIVLEREVVAKEDKK